MRPIPGLKSPVRYLSGRDVDAVIPGPRQQRELVKSAYRSIGAGTAVTPAAPHLSPRPGTFVYPLPAYLADDDLTSVKWVSDYPTNRERHGLPCVSGLIVINDSSVGLPVAIMDGAVITATRTAAVSAVCAAAFAREGWTTVGIVGYGVQAKAHVKALSDLNPTASFRVYSRRGIDVDELHISAVATARAAVEDADIVITGMPLGANLRPPVSFDWLKPTALVLPIDDDASLDPGVVGGARAFYVDALDDYRQRQGTGTFPGWREPDGTVPAAVLEGQPARGVTVCANQGLGVLDAAFAGYVLSGAERDGVGLLLER